MHEGIVLTWWIVRSLNRWSQAAAATILGASKMRINEKTTKIRACECLPNNASNQAKAVDSQKLLKLIQAICD